MQTLNSTPAEAPKMYETENDISKQRRTELNALLNRRRQTPWICKCR
jgi:hypothetical protein